MALITQSSSPLLHSPLHPLPTKTKLTIRSQDPSLEPQKPTINGGPTDDTSSVLAPPKKPNSTGLGFGSSSSSAKPNANPLSTKSKPRSRRERATIIRRSPVEKPEFLSQQGEVQSKEQSRNESAFLLAWLGLGSIILVEGIVLAASGFLPEKWDKFFVKYLYPSFTPTVFLFVAGTVGYGVLKYLQNEELKSKK